MSDIPVIEEASVALKVIADRVLGKTGGVMVVMVFTPENGDTICARNQVMFRRGYFNLPAFAAAFMHTRKIVERTILETITRGIRGGGEPQ